MCVAVDTCVLIDFLRIGRMDLIGNHPSRFISTDEVAAEILYPEQSSLYKDALAANYLEETSIKTLHHDSAIGQWFLYLSTPLPEIRPLSEINFTFQHIVPLTKNPLGPGERSVIAVAHNCNYRLATDDTEAIRYAQAVFGNQLCILGTQENIPSTQKIMVELIQHGILSVGEADHILAEWQQYHRGARWEIGSFDELL